MTVLDLDALLAPIAGGNPAGQDPREDATAGSLYYRLRDARAEARAMEREADSSGLPDSAPPPQWRTVRELAARILGERAKDLEAAAWLTEALVRESGAAGLCAGASLMAGLVERFWAAGLFPTPDEDGLATLVAPIGGLNGYEAEGTLPQPLRKQAMFLRPDGGVVTFWQFLQAEEVEGIGDAARKKQRLAAGVPSFADVERDARVAGGGHFAALRDQLDAAIAAWDRLAAVLEAQAAADAPPTRRLRELLDTLLRITARYAPARAAAPAPDEQPADAAEAAAPSTAPGTAARTATREDMLRDLARIAEFFRRSEPQSPLSLTLEEAIRRARLSWPELLQEVVPNEDARNAMLVMLGIRPTKPE